MELNRGLLSFKDKKKKISKLVHSSFWLLGYQQKFMIPTGFLHHTNNFYEFKPKYNYQK